MASLYILNGSKFIWNFCSLIIHVGTITIELHFHDFLSFHRRLSEINLSFIQRFNSHTQIIRDSSRSLIADNRTYHFQAEDESEQRAWTSVLVNCKEGALMRAFHQQAGESHDNGHSLLDLQRSIIRAVRAMPGNQVCADCGSSNGEDIQTNRITLIIKRARVADR